MLVWESDGVVGFACRRLSGSCPTSQQETSSRSRLWSVLAWFQWSSSNWPRCVCRVYTSSYTSFFLFADPRPQVLECLALVMLSCRQRDGVSSWSQVTDDSSGFDTSRFPASVVGEKHPCTHQWQAFSRQGDFGTQKEAAWAISNLTISGRKDQVSLGDTVWLVTWTGYIHGGCTPPLSPTFKHDCGVCARTGAVPGGTGCYPTFLQPAVGERLPGGAGCLGRLEKYSHHGRRWSQHYCRDHRGVWRSVSLAMF